jgi:hypothetical protein
MTSVLLVPASTSDTSTGRRFGFLPRGLGAEAGIADGSASKSPSWKCKVDLP